MDTYESQAEANADKAQLQAMLAALNGAHSQMRLDSCRCWTIRGKRGYLATWGGGKRWLVYCRTVPPSARKWNNIRRSLSHLGRCTQDGDDEGIIRIDRLPTPEEAAIIRNAIGLVQTRPAPAHGFKVSPTKSPVQAPNTRESIEAGTPPHTPEGDRLMVSARLPWGRFPIPSYRVDRLNGSGG